jgi:hypothetical protein
LKAKRVWLAAFVTALSCPATAQVAILQIKTIEGEGTVHAPGSRTNRLLTVEVSDETGKPVEAAAVSFHLPEDGPGGTFANGLRTDVATTDSHGRAGLHSVQFNRVSGRFQIRILASKEQARAGIVSFQYIAEAKSGAATPTAGKSHGHAKWIAVAALVGGGAVAGILVSGKSGSSSVPAAAGLTAAPPAVLSVGPPSISVGRP